MWRVSRYFRHCKSQHRCLLTLSTHGQMKRKLLKLSKKNTGTNGCIENVLWLKNNFPTGNDFLEMSVVTDKMMLEQRSIDFDFRNCKSLSNWKETNYSGRKMRYFKGDADLFLIGSFPSIQMYLGRYTNFKYKFRKNHLDYSWVFLFIHRWLSCSIVLKHSYHQKTSISIPFFIFSRY